MKEDIKVGCDYHDINSFNQLNTQYKNNICLFHVDIRSLRKNIEKLSMILADLQVPPRIFCNDLEAICREFQLFYQEVKYFYQKNT